MIEIRDQYIAHTDSPERSGRRIHPWPGTLAIGSSHTAYEDGPPPDLRELIAWQKSALKSAFLATRDLLERVSHVVMSSADRTTSLFLAAIDMEQTIQAAKMLLEEIAKPDFPNKHQRVRALETAIAVTYARSLADNRGSFVVPQNERAPASRQLRELHDHLLLVRHKAYARTSTALNRRGLQALTTAAASNRGCRGSSAQMFKSSSSPSTSATGSERSPSLHDVAFLN